MRLALVGAASILAGCTNVTPVFGPNGQIAYQIDCPETGDTCGIHDRCEPKPADPIKDCRDEAARYCPHGFDIAAQTQHFGTAITGEPYGLVERHVILVTCRAGPPDAGASDQ